MELSADPPCCKIKCCKYVFEENASCKSIALILSIVPVVSTSLNNDDIRNTAWTYGESDDFKFWIGLNKVVYEGRADGSFQWNDAECTNIERMGGTFCDDCKSSCLGAVTMVITNLITTLPNIKGNISRSTRQGDRNCGKTMALITGIIGTASTLVALSLYADVCARQLPDTILEQDISYEIGPGFLCLLCATLLKPIDVIINALMPVPDQEDNAAGTLKQDLLQAY